MATGEFPMKTEFYDRIDEVSADDWNRLAHPHSWTLSHEYWKVIHDARLEGFRFGHVVIRGDDGGIDALATYYEVATDIAIFAPAWLRRILFGVRRLFPGFLKIRMLECGAPVCLVSPPLVVDPEKDLAKRVTELNRALDRQARRWRCWLIVVRDFEPDTERMVPLMTADGYRWLDGLPNTWMDVKWATVDDYVGSMQSYYRSKLLKHVRRCTDAGIRCEVVSDFAQLAPVMAAQWRVVHDSASEYQREQLNAAYYQGMAERLPGRALALLFYRGDTLIGNALVLHDNDVLRWLFFGREKAENDGLYLFTGYNVVATAIKLGVRRVEMGLTTYPVKQDLGAQVVPIRFAIRSPVTWLHRVVVPVYSALNDTPDVHNRDIFKRETGNKRRRQPGKKALATA
jgi:predicted N-acyltransferase